MSAGQVHWCADGDPFSGRPAEVMRLLADEGKTYGYGYGPGWTMVFGSAQGGISVNPGQWIVRSSDGQITVRDERAADQ